ncbi:MAG TPA: MBL fold metallo-hydrolase [Gammaproteobacteria bacterium]|nr:MBL fold metallo-hydrolase [Gammaproteobacteria bacterium]
MKNLASKSTASLVYPEFPIPAPGERFEVTSGIFWLRLPLPFALDHINLWLLRDGPDWLQVDTGVASDIVKQHWHSVLANLGAGQLRRILVTHFHPDHVGLAGWLEQQTGASLYMNRTEWLMANWLQQDQAERFCKRMADFFLSHGLDEQRTEALRERGNVYRQLVSPPPMSFHDLNDGDALEIDGQSWQVLIGKGHALEHVCLHNPERKILLAGDQILPQISPNISLLANQPHADPLADYLVSLQQFSEFDPETLVLPAHGRPFFGLPGRAHDLLDHHQQRLQRLQQACQQPQTAADLLPILFARPLDAHQIIFAMSECLAHLRYLQSQNRIDCELRKQNTWFYTIT